MIMNIYIEYLVHDITLSVISMGIKKLLFNLTLGDIAVI